MTPRIRLFWGLSGGGQSQALFAQKGTEWVLGVEVGDAETGQPWATGAPPPTPHPEASPEHIGSAEMTHVERHGGRV